MKLEGELVIRTERADGFNFLTEEIYPVWLVCRKGEEVGDASPDGILAGLINEICSPEVIFPQNLFKKVN